MSDLIINIEKETRKVILEQIYIGNDHENLQERLVFKFDEFVNGQARLEYEINDTKNYIILTKENETYTIPVQNVITIYQEETIGKIKFQLVVTEGTEEENIPVYKSNIFYLRCRPSINAVTEAPEGYDLWIEQANAKLNLIDTALDEVDNLDIDISKSGKVTTVSITNKNGTTKSENINDGNDGEAGPANTLSVGTVVKGENAGATITGTAPNQTLNLVLPKGDKGDKGNPGEQGEPGNDGISPTATVTKSGDTTTITITDKNGTTTAEVKDGEVGETTDVKINGTSITNNGVADIKTNSTYNASTNKLATMEDVPSEVTETTVANWGFTKNTGTYSKPSGGIPDADLSSSVQTSLGKADTALQQHQDISGKQNITDNTLNTTNKTIPSAINEVNGIAKGANQALSYSNYQAMVTAFNALDDDVYNVGQNVMIVTLEVPDLWISGIESTSSTYIYIDDTTIVSELQTNGYIQVGYYKLSMLETQKVDLTNYITNTNYATASSAGIIKVIGSFAVSTGASGDVLGCLYAVTKTNTDYESMSNLAFVGKGTLENVLTARSYEPSSNKVVSTTGLSSSSTDTQYPSAKCVYDYIQSLDATEVAY